MVMDTRQIAIINVILFLFIISINKGGAQINRFQSGTFQLPMAVTSFSIVFQTPWLKVPKVMIAFNQVQQQNPAHFLVQLVTVSTTGFSIKQTNFNGKPLNLRMIWFATNDPCVVVQYFQFNRDPPPVNGQPAADAFIDLQVYDQPPPTPIIFGAFILGAKLTVPQYSYFFQLEQDKLASDYIIRVKETTNAAWVGGVLIGWPSIRGEAIYYIFDSKMTYTAQNPAILQYEDVPQYFLQSPISGFYMLHWFGLMSTHLDMINPSTSPGLKQFSHYLTHGGGCGCLCHTWSISTFALFYIPQVCPYCNQCHDSCSECTYDQPQDCLSCSDTVTRDQIPSKIEPPPDNRQTYVCPCQQGYFEVLNEASCSKCHPSCETCQNYELNCISCDSVSQREMIGSNQCKCKDGYYENGVKVCEVCHSSCITCIGPLPTDCTSCGSARIYHRIDNSSILGGTCPCMEGFYDAGTGPECACQGSYLVPNPVTGQNECMPCSPLCLGCTGPNPNQCTLCDGQNQNRVLDQNNECVCKPYFYESQPGVCSQCYYTCATCSDSTNSCLSCSGADNRVMVRGSCQCKDGFFNDPNLKTCVQCHPACQTCTGSSIEECKTCNKEYWLDKNRDSCRQECPMGTVGVNATWTCQSQCPVKQFINLYNRVCIECNERCIECYGPSYSQCTRCEFAYFLFQNNCFESCPPGYYADINQNQCLPCNKGCLTCFERSQNDCLSCLQGLYLAQSTCVEICPIGLWGNTDTNMCIDSCLPGFYQNSLNRVCQKCADQCQECEESSYQCTQCKQKYFLFDKKCLMTCPETRYYADQASHQCQICHYQCLQCSSKTENDCLECNQNFFAISVSNAGQVACTQICPDSTYPDLISNTCQKCDDEGCISCSVSGKNKCHECDFSFTFNKDENYCIPQCQSQEYFDSANQICGTCFTTCATCFGPHKNQCITCISIQGSNEQNMILANVGNCQCPFSTYLNSAQTECLSCGQGCQSCKGLKNTSSCLQCVSMARISTNNPSECDCVDGYFFDIQENSCSPCQVDYCITCSSNNNNLCEKCLPGFITIAGKCFCDGSKYSEKGDFSCNKSCPNECEYCNGPNLDKTIGNICISKLIKGANQENLGCHYSCGLCLGDSFDSCLVCSSETRLISQFGICDCKSGYLESGEEQCTSIEESTFYLSEINDAQFTLTIAVYTLSLINVGIGVLFQSQTFIFLLIIHFQQISASLNLLQQHLPFDLAQNFLYSKEYYFTSKLFPSPISIQRQQIEEIEVKSSARRSLNQEQEQSEMRILAENDNISLIKQKSIISKWILQKWHIYPHQNYFYASILFFILMAGLASVFTFGRGKTKLKEILFKFLAPVLMIFSFEFHLVNLHFISYFTELSKSDLTLIFNLLFVVFFELLLIFLIIMIATLIEKDRKMRFNYDNSNQHLFSFIRSFINDQNQLSNYSTFLLFFFQFHKILLAAIIAFFQFPIQFILISLQLFLRIITTIVFFNISSQIEDYNFDIQIIYILTIFHTLTELLFCASFVDKTFFLIPTILDYFDLTYQVFLVFILLYYIFKRLKQNSQQLQPQAKENSLQTTIEMYEELYQLQDFSIKQMYNDRKIEVPQASS